MKEFFESLSKAVFDLAKWFAGAAAVLWVLAQIAQHIPKDIVIHLP